MKTAKYIAFLRGINIGTHQVKMERLRELFREAGLSDVRSYIQTGNIFFETAESDRASLTSRIEQQLFDALGYEVPTFLRTLTEVETMLQSDPFKHLAATPETRFLISFIPRPLPDSFVLPLISPKNDFEILQATAGEVFSVMRMVNGRPSNPAAFIERKCQLKTTSRFFGTTQKILRAAQGS